MDFTGDMPVILGPDGPSLGGFVCPVVVSNADRWKLAQLVPGDTVQLQLVDRHQAQQMSAEQATWLAGDSSKTIGKVTAVGGGGQISSVEITEKTLNDGVLPSSVSITSSAGASGVITVETTRKSITFIVEGVGTEIKLSLIHI